MRFQEAHHLPYFISHAEVVFIALPSGLAAKAIENKSLFSKVLLAEENHRTDLAVSRIVILGGILKYLLGRARTPGRKYDPVGGNREEPILPEAIGEVFSDMNGE